VILVADVNLAEVERAAVLARVIADLTVQTARILDESNEAAPQAARTRGWEGRLFGRGRRARFTDLTYRPPTRPCGGKCGVARASRSKECENLRVLSGGFTLVRKLGL
jgi:hypothetical protein